MFGQNAVRTVLAIRLVKRTRRVQKCSKEIEESKTLSPCVIAGLSLAQEHPCLRLEDILFLFEEDGTIAFGLHHPIRKADKVFCCNSWPCL